MSDPREQLAAMAGEWEGTTKLWFEPDVVVEEYRTRGTIRKMAEGKFHAHEYEETFQGKTHRALAIYAWNDEAKLYECSWIHSFHMSSSILFSTGQGRGPTGFFVLGTYGDGQGGPRWGWRTDHALEGDRLVITAWNITPDGEEAKAVETVYARRA